MEWYLDGWRCLATGTSTLRSAACELLNRGVSRRELVERAVAAGYNERSVRKVLSELLVRAGQRLRRPGGGRKSPPQVEAIIAFARSEFGEKGDKLVHAASRSLMKEAADQRAQNQAGALFRSGIRPVPPPDQIFHVLQPSPGRGGGPANSEAPQFAFRVANLQPSPLL